MEIMEGGVKGQGEQTGKRCGNRKGGGRRRGGATPGAELMAMGLKDGGTRGKGHGLGKGWGYGAGWGLALSKARGHGLG